MPTYGISILSVVDEEMALDLEDDSVVELYFHTPKATFTVEKEYLVYDAAAFAGDVGGMGGILLGISVVAVYQEAAELVRALLAWLDAKRSRRRRVSRRDT